MTIHLLLVILELILVDLILGGDNAVVIALATKNLDKKMKKKASLIGAMIAIGLRIVFILIIILLGEKHIPFLNLIAGTLLIYIALGLLKPQKEEVHVNAKNSLWGSVKTIVVADAIMSLDNAIVIASVAASAGLPMAGEMTLVFFALLISFPIILFGATLLSKLMDKFSYVIYFFTYLLLHSAISMMIKDVLLNKYSTFLEGPIMSILVWILPIIIIIIFSYFLSKNKKGTNK